MPSDGLAARCNGLVRIYSTATGEVHALKGVDASFPRGTVTAVVGPSGSGKSSLLRILAGMDRPTAGSVEVAGHNLADLARRTVRRLRRSEIGYVFQRPSDNLIPYLDAWEHMRAAAKIRGLTGVPKGRELLKALGLDDRIDHKPEQLSGGEQQRLAFAQALVGDPELVVADEPTAELDSASAGSLLREIHNLSEAGTAFVVSTHDPKVVDAADRTLQLRHGILEAETHFGRSLAVIDAAGRIQLPQDALPMFEDRRAVVSVEQGQVRITPP